MRTLSAVDAISPALQHTRRLLFDKRDWRLLLKIGAVAVFAEMGGCNSSFNLPGNHHAHGKAPAIMAAVLAFVVLIAIAAVLIGLVFFYIGSRLQFVLFDVVLRSDTTVAPIWRRFGGVTWRWIGLKLLFFLLALICIAPLLIPFVLHFIHTARMQHNGQIADPAAFIISILGFVASIFILVIVFSICYMLLRDFGLPSMALENASIGVTVQRILRLVRLEPGQVALYLLMHFLLRLAGAILCYFVLFFAMLIALIPLGGGGLALWLGLRHAGPGGHVLMIAGWVVLGLILAALLIVAGIMLFGYMLTFFQAYTLYFLGGRYPMLGAYLEAGMPPPAVLMHPPPP